MSKWNINLFKLICHEITENHRAIYNNNNFYFKKYNIIIYILENIIINFIVSINPIMLSNLIYYLKYNLYLEFILDKVDDVIYDNINNQLVNNINLNCLIDILDNILNGEILKDILSYKFKVDGIDILYNWNLFIVENPDLHNILGFEIKNYINYYKKRGVTENRELHVYEKNTYEHNQLEKFYINNIKLMKSSQIKWITTKNEKHQKVLRETLMKEAEKKMEKEKIEYEKHQRALNEARIKEAEKKKEKEKIEYEKHQRALNEARIKEAGKKKQEMEEYEKQEMGEYEKHEMEEYEKQEMGEYEKHEMEEYEKHQITLREAQIKEAEKSELEKKEYEKYQVALREAQIKTAAEKNKYKKIEYEKYQVSLREAQIKAAAEKNKYKKIEYEKHQQAFNEGIKKAAEKKRRLQYEKSETHKIYQEKTKKENNLICAECYTLRYKDIWDMCYEGKNLSEREIEELCIDHFNNYGFDEYRIAECTNLCLKKKDTPKCSCELE